VAPETVFSCCQKKTFTTDASSNAALTKPLMQVAPETVFSCCGCESSAGAVKRAKAPTAYMLLYCERKNPSAAFSVPVPPGARQIVQDLNDSVRERRRAEAERLNRLPCIIRWDVTSGGRGGPSGGAEGAGSRSEGEGGGGGGSGADGAALQYEMVLSKSEGVRQAADTIMQAVLPLLGLQVLSFLALLAQKYKC
jgi:hypothetical protein